MDVLQAIHLLLAFELFVVVVGVDPRWLLYSLKQRSPAFQDEANEHAVQVDEHDRALRTTPLNYLEKIFQIPFTLRPMTDTGFNRLIDKLIQGDRESPSFLDPSPREGKLVGDTATGATAGTDGTVVGRELLPVTPSVASTTSPGSATGPYAGTLKVEAEYLAIDEWERKCMKKFYCLIPSPRATKRFVNIYRLLRASAAIGTDRDTQSGEPERQRRAMLLLLAILIGYPAEATEIMSSLIDGPAQGTRWWDFITSFTERTVVAANGSTMADGFAASEEGNAHQQQSPQPTGTKGADPLQGGASTAMNPTRWRELLDKLKSVRKHVPESENDDCTAFARWAPQVARYSFRSGLTLLARHSTSKMPTGPDAARKIP